MTSLRVLLVDDESELRKSVSAVLMSSLAEFDFDIIEASNGKEALLFAETQEFDVVLMDVKMPEMDGLQALKGIKSFDQKIFIVIMTAHANLNDAILAIKEGAYDYIEKPVQPEKLVEIMRKAIETQELVSDLALSNPIMDDDVDTEFVGSSKKMSEIFNLIHRLSQVETTVMIRGENGTGKELVAKAIHFNSPRKHGDFVAINCGAIPEELMESELFGHERGAFTGAHERKIGRFQMANRGTLFLDEIGELKPELQVKLLRVLQEKKFVPVGGNREVKTSARIVTATNRNLEKMIQEGQFREDLFYRLNVMPIFMPPLRERLDDLEGLLAHFIKKFNRKHGKEIRGFSSNSIEMMKRYNWPGNIRELENVVERAFVISTKDFITEELLPETIGHVSEDHVNFEFPQHYAGPLDFDKFKEETEKEFILQALRINRGRINQTVAQANIPKNTLLRKIKKYNINVKDLAED